jgi:hypothetical protein
METTSDQPYTLGGKISIEEAKLYVSAYPPLKDSLKRNVLTKITGNDRLTMGARLTDAEKYFNSDVNAFIFSEETITRFFKESETGGKPAKYLMVLLAAKYNGTDKSNPTVVLAGVNDHPTKADAYVSLDIPDPATEHPPVKASYEFPGPDKANKKNIEFTII